MEKILYIFSGCYRFRRTHGGEKYVYSLCHTKILPAHVSFTRRILQLSVLFSVRPGFVRESIRPHAHK